LIFGKVVDEAIAKNLSKAMCLPLKLTWNGPAFYLDGRGVSNPNSSHWCPAWSVPPLGAKDSVTAADATGPQPKKKAKKTSYVTHQVIYQNAELTVNGTKLAYSRPVLVDSQDGKAFIATKCHRQLMDWDSQEFEKAEKVVRIKSCISN